MERIKILHCADMHFDTPFSGLGDRSKARIRREDLRETFLNITKLADQEKVDLLLIAGDLFDSSSVTMHTINFLIEAFESIKHIPIFIAPGNHDPVDFNSYYRTIHWPSNVKIFDGNITYIELPEINTRVYGAGFTEPIVNSNLLENFEVEDNSFINILLMHADICSSVAGSSDYNPVTESSLAVSKLNYAAFGHKHEYSGVIKAGDTYYSYPGCPEGRGFDESGEKGVLLGYVYKDRCELEFIRTCKRIYREICINTDGCSTYNNLFDKIIEAAGESSVIKNDLFKIIISGTFDKEFNPKPDVLSSKLKDVMFFSKLKIISLPYFDADELKAEYSLKGIFVRRMLSKIETESSHEQKEILSLALNLGLAAFDHKEVFVDDY